MRIAVTYDNGQIWQHFGKTEFFKFYDVEDGRIIKSEVVSTNGAGHGALADFLAENKVDAVICGGVGSPMIGRLEGYGIKAYPGVAGDADQAVAALLGGTLKTDEAAVHSGCHHHS
jgi:predicted Fe-Mo cluster-binding NifX family protein